MRAHVVVYVEEALIGMEDLVASGTEVVEMPLQSLNPLLLHIPARQPLPTQP